MKNSTVPMNVEDPTAYASAAQRRAADPERSVWVNASAGTGKTKVLIERVLRLLLPRIDGTPGALPHRILCLTYTRAAAQEMTERLIARVSRWAVCDEVELIADLTDMMDISPSTKQLQAARRLFTRLIDGPDHVRLMTIHAFCASILARFPLEAGIAPHFTQIEGAEIDDALQMARQMVLQRSSNDAQLAVYLDLIHAELSDDRLGVLLDGLFSERRQLQHALIEYSPERRVEEFRKIFSLTDEDTIENWTARVCHPDAWVIDDLRRLGDGLLKGIAKEKQYGGRIIDWLNAPESARAHLFDRTLHRAFFADSGMRYKEGTTQGARKADPDLAVLYTRMGDIVADLAGVRMRIQQAQANVALLAVAEHILQAYNNLKQIRGQLDFDDLIRATVRLLGADQNHAFPSTTPSWVMYKLEGGIDHVLVDEAQDTNPEQWQIIAALTDDLNVNDPDCLRTIFVVGDQKQSIYRFQGADPDVFDAMRGRLDHRTCDQSKNIDRIPLNTSFRSGAAVLTLVDQVFHDPVQYRALRLDEPTVHVIKRQGQGSMVELWPYVEPKEHTPDPPPWTPPIHIQPLQDVHSDLARQVASKVKYWLDQRVIIPSYDRPIEPRDILILVRKREPLMSLLRAALKSLGVPVAGVVRQAITDSLVVKDILALMRFVVLPDDDLNLACVLKGPFIGLHDDDLITLAPTRTGSLWQAIQNHPAYTHVDQYLQGLLINHDQMTPYILVTNILNSPCLGAVNTTGMMAVRHLMGDDQRVSIEDILDVMMDAEQDGLTLQQTLDRLEKAPSDVKRESLPGDNVVRILTVHGSKGLEAPIVILPDTTGTPRAHRNPPLFWPDETGVKLPIWSPRKADRADELLSVEQRGQDADRAEDRRLLYVALTRAQDWLIIAGAKMTKDPNPDCWYEIVGKAMENLATIPGYTNVPTADGVIQQLVTPQTAMPDNRAREGRLGFGDLIDELAIVKVPDLLRTSLVDDPQPARPYRATPASSRLNPMSPLQMNLDPHRFTRGLMTHKLLQVLPTVPETARFDAARAFLSARASQLPNGMADLIWTEVHNILHHPDFAPLFTADALAEVPITGMTADGRLIVGQIDRLLITGDTILVIDYKTNRPPPTDAAQIPAAYIEQMKAYRDLLVSIYPGRRVRCALLWTDGPRLMDVPLNDT